MAVWSCLILALSVGVAACGGDDGGGGNGTAGGDGGKTLTVYSSLPLQGASRPQSEDVIKGIRLALKQRGGKAGDFTIKYVSLDDATAAAGKWDAGQTKANARKAAQDDSTIAYIGEFNSGASANSIPTLNEAGILQVSPSNTALGLTKGGEGAEPGEPDKYYPTGKRNYGRVVPIDTIQGAALCTYMQDEGVKSVYILDDNEVYGKGVAANTKGACEKVGIEIAGEDSWEGKASNYRALAAKVKASGADAIFTGGIIDNNGPQLYKDLNAANPDAKIFGPDGMATVDMTKELPEKVQAKTYLTAPTVSPDELPPAGQKFYEDFQQEYGEAQDEIDPYAVYGYEAMDVVLDAIEKGGDDRQAVIDAFFSTKDKESVLGTYSIDPDGDTTLTTYGGYLAKGGKLVFNKALKAEGAA
ncbi:MAG TPA: branched-chain amino acid ABC transporter substrate-binding protein [Solirubrobacteraceae bacterium]|nr:branched-chain amino acid ABC transporter substrate-binding protein [Solirubrobacteraceae bacterium]